MIKNTKISEFMDNDRGESLDDRHGMRLILKGKHMPFKTEGYYLLIFFLFKSYNIQIEKCFKLVNLSNDVVI